MEIEDWATSSEGSSDSQAAQDANGYDEVFFTIGDFTKLQFRKDASIARWKEEMRMAEVVAIKGRMWTTTGILRRGKIYCSIEEIMFFSEIGALHLLDDDDQRISLEDIYKNVAGGKYGCCWKSYEVYKHLKSLGFIVKRYGVLWSTKCVKQEPTTLEGTSKIGSNPAKQQ